MIRSEQESPLQKNVLTFWILLHFPARPQRVTLFSLPAV